MVRKYVENTGAGVKKIKIDIQEKWCEGEDILRVLFNDTLIYQVYRTSVIGELMILEH
jgi:hypothetical protein